MIKLGLITPVLSLFPGMHADWEQDGTIEDVARIAEGAERFGYEFVTCSEHVAIPVDKTEGRGPCYWDPLPTFGYLAARTSRIRLCTSVVVLPYHHPLDIAKRYGTLDRISGGRLVLGVGAGYLRPEFELLGIPFEGRNAVTDDALRALRASFGRRVPEYEGTHFRFSGMAIEPCGVQERLPIWVGGQTRRSLRRAVEYGDGWYPFSLTPDQVAEWLTEVQKTDEWHQRQDSFDVVLPARLDPLGARDDAIATATQLRDAGATIIALRVIHDSVERYLEQIEAMAQIAASL